MAYLGNDVPNIDAMSDADLATFIETPESTLADELFPKVNGRYPDNHIGLTGMLQEFASHTFAARRLRLAGHIPAALRLEAAAERVYRQLPEGARW